MLLDHNKIIIPDKCLHTSLRLSVRSWLIVSKKQMWYGFFILGDKPVLVRLFDPSSGLGCVWKHWVYSDGHIETELVLDLET